MFFIQICIIITVKRKKDDFSTIFRTGSLFFYTPDFFFLLFFFLFRIVKVSKNRFGSSNSTGKGEIFTLGTHHKIFYNNHEKKFLPLLYEYIYRKGALFMGIKYKNVADQLRTEILEQDTYLKSKKLPTEQELMQRYRVSRQTIRQALSLLFEEGLIIKKQGSGTYLSDRAISPARTSGSIAILTPFAGDATFPAMLWDIQTILSDSDFQTRVFSTENRFDRERNILQSLLEMPPRGILAVGTHTAFPNPNLDLYRRLLALGTSIVFFGSGYPDLPEVPLLSPDEFSGGYRITSHLIRSHHTKIAGIFRRDDRRGLLRWYGCACALRDHSLLSCDRDFFWYETDQTGNLSDPFDPSALSSFLDEILPRCTAVICQDDEAAYFLIRELLRRGIRIPDDISVTGFDNSYFSDISPVRITTLSTGSVKLWVQAAKLLLLSINGKTASEPQPVWQLEEKDSVLNIPVHL